MLKIKIKATGQIIEVKDFSRIIIDEENWIIKCLNDLKTSNYGIYNTSIYT